MESRPLNTRTSVTGKRMHWPSAVSAARRRLRAGLDADDALALVELHGDLAVAVHLDEVGQLVAPPCRAWWRTSRRASPTRLVLRQRHDRGDALALSSGSRLTSALPRACGAPAAAARPSSCRPCRARRRTAPACACWRRTAGDEILVARRHAGAALAAAALRPVGGERHALDVAGVGDGDDHVLALDQVLVLDLALAVDDLGARGVANSSRSRQARP
jgi:hypothetical protein